MSHYTPKMSVKLDSSGDTLVLLKKLGFGGEAEIWTIEDKPDKLLKLYKLDIHKGDKLGARIDKIRYMLDNPLKDLQPTDIAWPEELVKCNDTDKYIGFIMPRINGEVCKLTEIHNFENTYSDNDKYKHLNWLTQHIVLKNLVDLVAKIHDSNLYIRPPAKVSHDRLFRS
jgi:DNA-binding helix-hairpin-helix protein with protein kinase domain